jgi:hypothetical protein
MDKVLSVIDEPNGLDGHDNALFTGGPAPERRATCQFDAHAIFFALPPPFTRWPQTIEAVVICRLLPPRKTLC